jgi:5-methylcytosine-specific restriction endonuclease McrA
MGRSLYSTVKWQRLRLAILQRDGRVCQIRGRRCTTLATIVHHIIPASVRPDLFFTPTNLQAACKPCNYGDGAVVRADNRTARQLVAHLQFVVEEQQAEIDELSRQLEELQQGGAGVAHGAVPRIY